MEAALHRGARPRTFGLDGTKHLRRLAVYVGEDVEDAVVIAEARRPDTVAVNVLPVFKAILGTKVKFVQRIGLEVPIDQVTRVEHGKPGHHVHRRTEEIEVAADTNDVRIGKLIVEDRVRVGAVPVIRGPGLRRDAEARAEHEDRREETKQQKNLSLGS